MGADTLNEIKEIEEKKKSGYKTGWWVALIIVALLIFYIVICCTILNPVRTKWWPRAKSVVRNYAETQIAYSNQHENGFFGTWDELKETDYLAEGYTKENIIELYTLWTSVNNYSSLDESGNMSYNRELNTFTVVAFPNETGSGKRLKTYAIREDMVLRVYNPHRRNAKAWGEDGDYGCRTWEPIR